MGETNHKWAWYKLKNLLHDNAEEPPKNTDKGTVLQVLTVMETLEVRSQNKGDDLVEQLEKDDTEAPE